MDNKDFTLKLNTAEIELIKLFLYREKENLEAFSKMRTNAKLYTSICEVKKDLASLSVKIDDAYLDLTEYTGSKDSKGNKIFVGDTLISSEVADRDYPDGYTYKHTVGWSDKFCGWFAKNITDESSDKSNGSVQLWVYLLQAKDCQVSKSCENT